MEKSCIDGGVHIDMSEGSINKSSDSRQCRKNWSGCDGDCDGELATL